MPVPTAISNTLLKFVDSLHLNFFRIHLIYFIVTPLIFSFIFWGVNGQYPISYIDSLFLCVSAHTVTGLSPINLSTTTGLQQAILFFLMTIGNYTIVSLVMVLVRKNYIVQQVLRERPVPHPLQMRDRLRSRTMAVFDSVVGNQQPRPAPDVAPSSAEMARNGPAPNPGDPTTAERSQVLETGDVTVSPSPVPDEPMASKHADQQDPIPLPRTPRTPFRDVLGEALYRTESPTMIDPVIPTTPNQVNFAIPLTQTTTNRSRRGFPVRPTMTRTGTIIITPVPGPARQGTGLFFSREPTAEPPRTAGQLEAGPSIAPTGASVPLSTASTHPGLAPPTYEKNFGGFPGPVALAGRLVRAVAPNAVDALRRRLTHDDGGIYTEIRTAPNANNGIDASGQTTSVSRTRTEQSAQQRHLRNHQRAVSTVAEEPDSAVSPVSPLAPPYMQTVTTSVGPVPEHLRHHLPGHKHLQHQQRHEDPHSHSHSEISHTASSSTGWMSEVQDTLKRKVLYLRKQRNSAFNTDELTDDELEELGGIEYRALRALAWIVGLYYFLSPLIMFMVFVIYLYSTNKYDDVFTSQYRLVPKAWFSAFQAISSYTGGGLTLVDQGMVPFADAHLLVIVQGWLIAAGSLALPIFLRLIVWLCWKLASPEQKPTLEFLLEHPRRCYLYMFPSHQTWFLLLVFLFLTLLQWFAFLVLDIGIPTIDAIPVGTRVLSSLFQSIAVRASGFAIVPLSAIAPAMKFLYLVMMYIAAYPIAMSIRSTNVYEQRSLGLYEDVVPLPEDSDPDVDEAAAKLIRGAKGEVLLSKYLGMHVRRQLSYDLWWLALAVFLICIVERALIMEPSNDTWFNQFQIMFELVSAYATIGLSLGIPTQNYSFSGALGPVSKLIICMVMLRGRHRDLPQAIDRAIMLPRELARSKVDGEGHHIMDVDPTAEPGLPSEAKAPPAAEQILEKVGTS